MKSKIKFHFEIVEMSKRQMEISRKKYVASQEDIEKRLEEIVKISNSLEGPKIKKDKVRGWGLYADRDYKKGEVITKYGGTVTSEKEGDYMAKSGKGSYVKYINGKFGFNVYSDKGRWINEYDRDRSKVNVSLGLKIRAIEYIKKGDQFFADYGDEFERNY